MNDQPLFPGTPAEQTADAIQTYRQERDEFRSAIKALESLHGKENVAVALHMANLKNIAIASEMPERFREDFVREVTCMVKHYARHAKVDPGLLHRLAAGLHEQIALMKSSIEEHGPLSNVMPMPTTGDDHHG